MTKWDLTGCKEGASKHGLIPEIPPVSSTVPSHCKPQGKDWELRAFRREQLKIETLHHPCYFCLLCCSFYSQTGRCRQKDTHTCIYQEKFRSHLSKEKKHIIYFNITNNIRSIFFSPVNSQISLSWKGPRRIIKSTLK